MPGLGGCCHPHPAHCLRQLEAALQPGALNSQEHLPQSRRICPNSVIFPASRRMGWRWLPRARSSRNAGSSFTRSAPRAPVHPWTTRCVPAVVAHTCGAEGGRVAAGGGRSAGSSWQQLRVPCASRSRKGQRFKSSRARSMSYLTQHLMGLQPHPRVPARPPCMCPCPTSTSPLPA